MVKTKAKCWCFMASGRGTHLEDCPKRSRQLTGQRLIQFQCLKEGTIFYYQHGNRSLPFDLMCPICGSSRTEQTGRVFDPVNETAPITEEPA